MPQLKPQEIDLVISSTRIGKILAADGVTKKQVLQSLAAVACASAFSPSDGDRIFLYFWLVGNETEINISNRKLASAGIFDLYVNSSLDSSGYDDYAGAAADVHRQITLSIPVKPGKNVIELRVNGKNALSTSYTIAVYGANVQ